MKPAVFGYARRFLVGLGTILLAYVVGAAAYGEIYQWRRSLEFEQTISQGEFTGADVASTVLHRGDLVARLEIRRIEVSVMVLHGVETETLRVGAGHVPATPLPGAPGNSVIAAHRDTFFRRLEHIRPGDAIHVSTVGGTYEYVVASTEVVGPEDTRVMESRGRTELTLITCHPFYYVGPAPDRFVVHARLAAPPGAPGEPIP